MATKEINLARLQQLRADARVDFAKELHAFLKADTDKDYLEKNEVIMFVFPNRASALTVMNESNQTIYSIDMTGKTLQQVKDIFASGVFNGDVDHPEVWAVCDDEITTVFGDDFQLGSDNLHTLISMLVYGENAAIRHEALKYDFEPAGIKF